MVDSVTHNEGEYTVLSMDRWAIKVTTMINPFTPELKKYILPTFQIENV